jgi:hypothetical protein
MSDIKLDDDIAAKITMLTVKEHFDIIKDGLDESTVLSMSDEELGERIKTALALEIVYKFFGGK